MKSLIRISIIICVSIFITNIGLSQTKNLKVQDVRVYGNCGMCKKTIEKAGNIKGVAKTEWDIETLTATITMDSTKTTIDDVLKKIAAAGYDSDKFRAPDKVYNNLHGCCQYERPEKTDN